MNNDNEVRMKQVAVSVTPDGDECLIGLDANGVVYRYLGHRDTLKEACQETNYRKVFGPWQYWWQPLRMRTDKGEEPHQP